MKEFRLKLKEARSKKDIKQSELAEIMGTTQTRISEYEVGKVLPSLERLIQLAQILDVSLDELVEFKKIHVKYSNDLSKKGGD